MSKDAQVVVLDLTSRTPPYDRALVEALDTCGCGVELWAAGSHGDNFDAMTIRRRAGIDWAMRVPATSKAVRKRLKAIEYAVNLCLLAIHLWRTRPGVLHIQWLPLLEVFPILECLLLRACKRWGIPLVYTVHDVLPLDAGAEHQRTYRQVYRMVDALICHTETTRRQLVEDFDVDPGTIHVIPHGPLLDGAVGLSKDEARRRLGLSLSVPIALQFGVLRPYKGADILLHAWEKVEEAVPSARLVIAGSGDASHTRELEQLLSQLNLQAVETDFRFLPEDELCNLIAAADVLVYPYRNITQSGALFAGMNAAKPIVATRVGGLAETLDDGRTGRLVDPEAPEPLGQVLVELLTTPEQRDQLGRTAKRVLDDQFSWEAIAQQTIQCYQSVQKKNWQSRKSPLLDRKFMSH